MTGESSLFQQTVIRMSKLSNVISEKSIIITQGEYRFIVNAQLEAIGAGEHSILIEPSTKDTAAAILAAAIFAYERDKNATLLVVPSDHNILGTENLDNGISAGIAATYSGDLVTFGIVPTRPETDYGYLITEGNGDDPILNVIQFIEKPDGEHAKLLLNMDNVLWNSGMYLLGAKAFIDICSNLIPETYKAVKSAVFQGYRDLNFFRLKEGPWKQIDSISVDYAIMEQLKTLKTVPLNLTWSDLGDWCAIDGQSEHDFDGVSKTFNTIARDCRDTMLYAHNESQILVGLGLENIIAIATDDAVLVANRNNIRDIKQVVTDLKERKIHQAEGNMRDYRPWGYYDVLINSDNFKVKTIIVNPGAILSLQSHHQRSEHWIVVRGTAKVTVDETVKLISEGESIYIPLGTKHRLENPGKLPMTLIEVQTGSYLGEDDIVRYEDLYSRAEEQCE